MTVFITLTIRLQTYRWLEGDYEFWSNSQKLLSRPPLVNLSRIKDYLLLTAAKIMKIGPVDFQNELWPRNEHFCPDRELYIGGSPLNFGTIPIWWTIWTFLIDFGSTVTFGLGTSFFRVPKLIGSIGPRWDLTSTFFSVHCLNGRIYNFYHVASSYILSHTSKE